MVFQRLVNIYVDSFRGLSREVWILATVILINRSGMMVLPFLALYATNELGFTIVQAGIVTGAYGAGSLVGSWIGGWLTDRIGFYKVLVWSLVFGGMGMMSLVLFHNYYALCLAIFITSSIADASRPPVMAAVSLFSKPENQTRAISLVRMALNLGISIGPAVAGFLAASAGYTWLFLLDGLTCIGAAIFLVVSLSGSQAKNPPPVSDQHTSSSRVLKDHVYLIFLVIAGINIMAFMQILSTAPLFFQEELYLTEAQIGLFFTFNGLLVFLFEMPLVALSQRKWRPFTSMLIGALMIGIGHMALNLDAHWLIVIILYNLFVSFGEIINFPFGNSLALTRAPVGQKGKYMGLWAMMFSVTFIVAPIVGTNLVDRYDFYTTWMVMACINFVTVPAFIWIESKWKTEKVP